MGRAAVVFVYVLRVLSFVVSVYFWIVTAVALLDALHSRSRRRR
jgi:hypothetical protein